LSQSERLLLVIALSGGPSTAPPRRRVTVRSVTTQLDNHPLFL
jgi:hypothetical protein